MRYGNLHFLWCLWLIPLLIVFYIWAFKRKALLISRFVAPELKNRLLKGVSFARQRMKAVIIILSVTFAIFALVRPKWGFHWEEVKRRGVDIIVALDVSKSMLAEDVSPNRLERAKREIIDLLNILQGDRVGLVAFAGASFLQTPLTLDYGAVQIFLDDLSTDLIPIPGTAMGEAIKTAMNSFDEEDKKSRVLILITDGEDHAGKPIEIAKEASKQKIKIYTIGIGKEGGAPIPDPEHGGFKKDRKGEVILTKLDEDTLQKIALNTGGSYVRSITGDLDLEKIYEDIRKSVEDKELTSGRRKRFEERFQWPLLLAILFLFFEAIYSERRGKRRRKIREVIFRKTSIIVLLFGLGFSSAHAQFLTGASPEGEELYNAGEYSEALKEFVDEQIDQPDNYDLKYNMANTYHKMKQYQEAEKLYQSTALYGDKDLAQKSYYNLGNTSYRQGKLQEAVEFYKKALELNPDDQDAKYNLEFVREEIKRRIEENKKRQQQQQQQQDQKQDQQQENQQQENQQQENQQQKDQKKQDQQQKQKQDKEQEAKDKEKQKGKQSKQDEKEKEKEQQQQTQAAEEKGKKEQEMSEEEALRWLSTLDEDRKKHIKKQMKGKGRYQVEKDW